MKEHYGVVVCEDCCESFETSFVIKNKKIQCNKCYLKKEVIRGVSTSAPIITNEKGAKQSDSPYRLDLVDPKALLAIGAVLKEGAAKYGEENWRGIDLNDHINHALVHIYAYLAGDTSDDHIEHAATRMIFALNKKLEL